MTLRERSLMSEPVHVYQNRKLGYKLEDMHYCGVCNGYYGVPHDDVHPKHEAWDWCACRKHVEARGEPREGPHGWIIGSER